MGVLLVLGRPFDFQIDEPVTALFGSLKHTQLLLELQATQEYTGQTRSVVFLPSQWERYLSWDMGSGFRGGGGVAAAAVPSHEMGGHGVGSGAGSDVSSAASSEASGAASGDTLARIVTGRARPMVHCGVAAVSNLGEDVSWTGHLLAAANTYGFGRMAWDPGVISAERVAQEWSDLTWGVAGEDEGGGGAGGAGADGADGAGRTVAVGEQVVVGAAAVGAVGTGAGAAAGAEAGDGAAGAGTATAATATGASIVGAQSGIASRAVQRMLLASHQAYENATAPLGLGYVAGADHYHLNLTAWMFTSRAAGDAGFGGGFNATANHFGFARGSTYGALYPAAAMRAQLADVASTPARLLLTFHNLP